MAFETKCDHIVWSRSYCIKEFLSAYGKKLPQVVKVTQGFHGDYFVDSISADEILRVHTHSQQKRVIGQDKYGLPLSLPVDFALPLQLVVDNQLASPPCTLKAMLKTMELPFKVRLSNVTPMTGDKEDFGVFRLDSEFEQRHLLVNCVLVDELEPRVRMVPSSLTAIRLVVAKGFDDKDMNWKRFLSKLDQVADTLDYNCISGGSDIAMYAAEALNSGKVPFENLVPNKFFAVDSGSVRKKTLTTLGMPALGLLKMVSGKLKKSPSNASERRMPSGHYETIRFPEAPGDSNCLPFTPLSTNLSASRGMDRQGSEEQEEWDNRVEESASPPPPLHRTIRDKPHPDRVTKELPEEPIMYSFRRKISTPETTSSPPPGLPPRGATKPGARPRSSSESNGLPGSRLSVGIRQQPDSRTSSSSQGVGVPERSPSIDPPSGPPPRVAPKPRSRLRSSPESGELPEGRPSLDLRPEVGSRMSSSSHGVGVPERPLSVDPSPGPSACVSPKPGSRFSSLESEGVPSQANKIPSRASPKPHTPPKTVAGVNSAPSTSGTESTNQISTWQEVPSDLSSLSVDQVTQCLQLLKLDQATIDLFRQKDLDGAFLTLLSEDKLREFLENDTSLSVIDKEKTVNFVKHKWRPM